MAAISGLDSGGDFSVVEMKALLVRILLLSDSLQPEYDRDIKRSVSHDSQAKISIIASRLSSPEYEQLVLMQPTLGPEELYCNLQADRPN